MAKTKEELQQIKTECEELSLKLKELSDAELDLVTGGVGLVELMPYMHEFIGLAKASNAIIGGADGPTSIFLKDME